MAATTSIAMPPLTFATLKQIQQTNDGLQRTYNTAKHLDEYTIEPRYTNKTNGYYYVGTWDYSFGTQMIIALELKSLMR